MSRRGRVSGCRRSPSPVLGRHRPAQVEQVTARRAPRRGLPAWAPCASLRSCSSGAPGKLSAVAHRRRLHHPGPGVARRFSAHCHRTLLHQFPDSTAGSRPPPPALAFAGAARMLEGEGSRSSPSGRRRDRRREDVPPITRGSVKPARVRRAAIRSSQGAGAVPPETGEQGQALRR